MVIVLGAVLFFLCLALVLLDIAIWLIAFLLIGAIVFVLWILGAFPLIVGAFVVLGAAAAVFAAVAALIRWDMHRIERNAEKKALGAESRGLDHEEYLWANRLGRYADPGVKRPE